MADGDWIYSLRMQVVGALKMLTLADDPREIGEALHLLTLRQTTLPESELFEAFTELCELLRPIEADEMRAREEGVRAVWAVYERLSRQDRRRIRDLAWEVFEWTEAHGASLGAQTAGLPRVIILPPEEKLVLPPEEES